MSKVLVSEVQMYQFWPSFHNTLPNNAKNTAKKMRVYMGIQRDWKRSRMHARPVAGDKTVPL